MGQQVGNPLLKYSQCCKKRIHPREAQAFANEQSEISLSTPLWTVGGHYVTPGREEGARRVTSPALIERNSEAVRFDLQVCRVQRGWL